MTEEIPKEVRRQELRLTVRRVSAVLAVGAWILAALWILLPVAKNNSYSAESILPPGYVSCAPPAWEVDQYRERPGCLERREQAPARAMTAMVIALPASWLWLGLRTPSRATVD